VANRGEIAVRVIRACRELNIATVGVYSQADEDSLHVKLADQAVCVGPPSNKDSYLNIPNIMQAAMNTNADAIHPGYGNLSEVAAFAENCDACGIKFIGPHAETIRQMQDKAAARRTMRSAGVPVIPGSDKVVEGEQDALRTASRLGYPILIKAAAKVHRLELNNEQVLEATKLRQEYFLRILEQEPLPAFPGVLKLIEAALGHQDFRVAIATSSTRAKSQAVLRSAKVAYEKMVYITSNEVKNKKPHPELFEKAVERLSISADTCIVIEDTPPGVKAAKSAGCKCIAVTNSMTAENLAEADVVVGSLEEVTIDSLVDLIRRNKR